MCSTSSILVNPVRIKISSCISCYSCSWITIYICNKLICRRACCSSVPSSIKLGLYNCLWLVKIIFRTTTRLWTTSPVETRTIIPRRNRVCRMTMSPTLLRVNTFKFPYTSKSIPFSECRNDTQQLTSTTSTEKRMTIRLGIPIELDCMSKDAKRKESSFRGED